MSVLVKNSDKLVTVGKMADRTCPKCGKVFGAPCWLRRHLDRKTPCEQVLRSEEGSDKNAHVCAACKRIFATRQAKSQHCHNHCKVQNKKTEGELDQKVQALQQQVAELLQKKTSDAGGPQNIQATNLIVNNGTVIQNTDNSNVDNSYKVLNQIQGDVNQIQGTMNQIQGNVNQQIANFLPTPAPTPGWPTKWPAPLVDPRPFTSPSNVKVDKLQQAAARLGVTETAACRKGEPRGVSALLVEVLRQAHEDPEQRNIYLSPDRGDQALVFVPRQWLLKPLQEATQHVFEQMVKRLADLPMQGHSIEQDLMAGAKDGFEKKPQAVVQTSNSAMTAHLKNMEALLRVPGQQMTTLEDATWTAGDEPPEEFCHEAFGHIKLESTLYTMEIDAGVNCADDVVEARYAEQSRQAIYSLGRQVLRWKAKNQTAVRVTEKTALIYTWRGWEEKPAAEVGEKLFRSFAEVVVSYVEGPVTTPLRPLGRYITQHINELVAEEKESLVLLGQYSQQAERVCATSTNPEFAKLKELMRAAKAQPQLQTQEEEEDILVVLGWNA